MNQNEILEAILLFLEEDQRIAIINRFGLFGTKPTTFKYVAHALNVAQLDKKKKDRRKYDSTRASALVSKALAKLRGLYFDNPDAKSLMLKIEDRELFKMIFGGYREVLDAYEVMKDMMDGVEAQIKKIQEDQLKYNKEVIEVLKGSEFMKFVVHLNSVCEQVEKNARYCDEVSKRLGTMTNQMLDQWKATRNSSSEAQTQNLLKELQQQILGQHNAFCDLREAVYAHLYPFTAKEIK